MKIYILFYRLNGQRPVALPAIYHDAHAALGSALIELNRLMRSQGYDGNYTMFSPYLAGESVNLTAKGESQNGYPQNVLIDVYVQPVVVDEDLAKDFEEARA